MSCLKWSDEQLRAAGLEKRKVNSIVFRLRKISEEMRAMGLSVYGASGSGHLMHSSRPTHIDLPGGATKADMDSPVAWIGFGFDGGDW